jgi:hypothetical protein
LEGPELHEVIVETETGVLNHRQAHMSGLATHPFVPNKETVLLWAAKG